MAYLKKLIIFANSPPLFLTLPDSRPLCIKYAVNLISLFGSILIRKINTHPNDDYR